MLAIVCPGQGSQTPGFLSPWLELPGLHDRLQSLSDAAGMDLVAHGTTSDADTIKDTAVAQPLIVAAGIVGLAALLDGDAVTAADVTTGHSVGEVTAAAAAGVLRDDEAVVLVRERGAAMAQASAARPTGMSAVLGGDQDDVVATIGRHGLTAANMNGGGQIVAAGTMEQLEALRADPPAKARVIPLKVAGAFHTEHMGPALEALERHAASLDPNDPKITLLSNKDGRPVTSGTEMLTRLVGQVANPVRWDLTMATLAEMGVTGLIELPPAGTLVGLAKRGLRGVQTLALKSPDDLAAARTMIEEHGLGRSTEQEA